MDLGLFKIGGYVDLGLFKTKGVKLRNPASSIHLNQKMYDENFKIWGVCKWQLFHFSFIWISKIGLKYAWSIHDY